MLSSTLNTKNSESKSSDDSHLPPALTPLKKSCKHLNFKNLTITIPTTPPFSPTSTARSSDIGSSNDSLSDYSPSIQLATEPKAPANTPVKRVSTPMPQKSQFNFPKNYT